MSNNSDEKLSRSERREKLKRQQQMKSFGMMIIGILIIIAAFVVISLIQPGVSTAKGKDYSRENVNGYGDPDAPIVIEVYSSFACIHCKNFADEAEEPIIENYVNSGQVYLVYRSFNGNPDDAAGIAGQAAYCAADQNSFWAMHDTIFANYSSSGYTPSQLINFAKALDLDTAQFSDCLNSGKYAETVLADFQKGYDLGITGTPSFTLNGEIVFRGNVPFAEFQTVIEQALANQN